MELSWGSANLIAKKGHDYGNDDPDIAPLLHASGE